MPADGSARELPPSAGRSSAQDLDVAGRVWRRRPISGPPGSSDLTFGDREIHDARSSRSSRTPIRTRPARPARRPPDGGRRAPGDGTAPAGAVSLLPPALAAAERRPAPRAGAAQAGGATV